AEGPTPAEAARVLGVTPDADRARIKEAYRQKVKTVHPDTDEGSEEAFKRVNRAYETLTDDG
ncbi:J domain-containing protein, partial [Natronoarchaeum mannanilyticum]